MSRAAERAPVVTGTDFRAEKRAAAETAAALVESGMWVGLGTGSTVAELLPPLGARRLDITCVATSPATEELAVAHGLDVRPFTDIGRLRKLCPTAILATDSDDAVFPIEVL